MVKVIIAPGNGCTNIRRSNWYGWLASELEKLSVTVVCENFPDPINARREIWIPHIKSLCDGAEEETILVGHSSGAQAAMRFAEENRLLAVVLVSATFSDLGDANERASNYYPTPDGQNAYKFTKMRENVAIWHQFHSDNDPFIPISEAKQIREGLCLDDSAFHYLPKRSHFFDPPFHELLDLVLSMASVERK